MTRIQPEVELVVLVTNQAGTLAASVEQLRAHMGHSWLLTLADNGSTDDTARVAQDLARAFDDVAFARLPTRPLTPRELRAQWAASHGGIVAFLVLQPNTDIASVLMPVHDHIACRTRRSPPIDGPRLGAAVDRRTALATFGGLGLAAALAACSSGSSVTKPEASSTTSSTTAGSGSIALAPEMTDGPFYLDLDKVRSDITEGRDGAPLALTLLVAEATTGAPMKGAAVDIWHADAEGLYSGFVDASADANQSEGGSDDDGTFLRGTQVTSRDGRATFHTIYPGWYQGRAVHIHLKVHAGGSVIHVGQLFFDDTLSDAVFASTAPYSSRPERSVRNANDSIYAGGGRQSTLAVTKRDDGYQAAMTIGVRSP